MVKLFSDKRGAGAIEYALIASLISVAAITAFHSVGGKLQASYNNTAGTIGNTL